MDAASLIQPTSTGAPAPAGELSERERAILAFERQWWKYAGAKEQAVRDLFGMSATRYYQVLNALIDTPRGARGRPDARQAAAPGARRTPAGPLGPPTRHRGVTTGSPPPERPGRTGHRAPSSSGIPSLGLVALAGVTAAVLVLLGVGIVGWLRPQPRTTSASVPARARRRRPRRLRPAFPPASRRARRTPRHQRRSPRRSRPSKSPTTRRSPPRPPASRRRSPPPAPRTPSRPSPTSRGTSRSSCSTRPRIHGLAAKVGKRPARQGLDRHGGRELARRRSPRRRSTTRADSGRGPSVWPRTSGSPGSDHVVQHMLPNRLTLVLHDPPD